MFDFVHIQVLDAFLAPGSELWMFSEVATSERDRKLVDGGLDPNMLMNIKLVHREGNAVIRRHLESLPLETFDSVRCFLFTFTGRKLKLNIGAAKTLPSLRCVFNLLL
jgi:hypothetical protein